MENGAVKWYKKQQIEANRDMEIHWFYIFKPNSNILMYP